MRADARERQERIIITACNLLRGRDIQALTLDEVAKAAGVGIATLYRNFPNRDALWHACLGHLMRQIHELQGEALAEFRARPADLLATWHSFVWDLVRVGLGALSQVMTPAIFGTLPPAVRELQSSNDEQGQQILDLMQEAGLVHSSITPQLLIKGFIALSRTSEQAAPDTVPMINSQLISLYLVGLRHGPIQWTPTCSPDQMDPTSPVGTAAPGLA